MLVRGEIVWVETEFVWFWLDVWGASHLTLYAVVAIFKMLVKGELERGVALVGGSTVVQAVVSTPSAASVARRGHRGWKRHPDGMAVGSGGSPGSSAGKVLRVAATPDGKLTDKPDLDALKQLYGQTFDGVLITRGNGKKTAVTPQDVYVALRQALLPLISLHLWRTVDPVHSISP